MAHRIAPTVNALTKSGVSVQLNYGRGGNVIELKSSSGETLWMQSSRSPLRVEEILRVVTEKLNDGPVGAAAPPE